MALCGAASPPLFQRYGMPVDPRLERATVLHLVSHRSGIPSRVEGNRFAPGVSDLLRAREPSAATAHRLLPEILKVCLHTRGHCRTACHTCPTPEDGVGPALRQLRSASQHPAGRGCSTGCAE